MRLEAIISVNIISSLFNSIIESTNPYQPYYCMKLFQIATQGLQMQNPEIKASYFMFLQEALTDSDTHAQLANLIGGSLLPIIYGLLTTDVQYPLIN